MKELIIIGAGPAGLSAAVYAIRKKIDLLVLSEETGGQVNEAHAVNNYLGLPEISGGDLAARFLEHAQKLGVEIQDGVNVENISKIDGGFKITAKDSEYQAKCVIVASGKTYRKLDVPGAKEFDGKGITYCATCDAPLYKGKTAAVVGAGDAGQDAAWQLTRYADKIYLLNKYPELRGDNISIAEQLKESGKVEFLNNCLPVSVSGEKFVKSIKVNCGGEERDLAVDGIFVEIGSVPASAILSGLAKVNEKEEIVIDPKTNMTSQPGIFAAGDCTDVPEKQMIIAAGEGAKAALNAAEFLKNNK